MNFLQAIYSFLQNCLCFDVDCGWLIGFLLGYLQVLAWKCRNNFLFLCLCFLVNELCERTDQTQNEACGMQHWPFSSHKLFGYSMVLCLEIFGISRWWSSLGYSCEVILVCSVLEVVGSFCTYWPKIFDARGSLTFWIQPLLSAYNFVVLSSWFLDMVFVPSILLKSEL